MKLETLLPLYLNRFEQKNLTVNGILSINVSIISSVVCANDVTTFFENFFYQIKFKCFFLPLLLRKYRNCYQKAKK